MDGRLTYISAQDPFRQAVMNAWQALDELREPQHHQRARPLQR
jgi:hypothetical protein